VFAELAGDKLLRMKVTDYLSGALLPEECYCRSTEVYSGHKQSLFSLFLSASDTYPQTITFLIFLRNATFD
jgi:hypothetical protein